jgi:DNA-binding response OmpR family regulator
MKRVRRIMLVDDEPDINMALRVVLTRGGYSVDTFDDPIHALEKIKPGYYDLLILDIKMPGMNGFELYKEIKKIDPKSKVCFLTASELYYENLRPGNTPVSNDLFIRKPVSNAQLLNKIKSLMEMD